jgi:hypothetical protein
MSYFLETISHNTTGLKTRAVADNSTGTPFTPTHYRITAGPKAGGTAFLASSVGTSDGTVQLCDSSYIDASRVDVPARFTDRIVFIREWSGAAYVTKVQTAHDSIIANGIKYNVATTDVNYQYMIEAWD